MSDDAAGPAFSISEARGLIRDLFRPNARIYWTDLLITLAVSYGAAIAYFLAPPGSARQIVALPVAGFAMFRAGSFIHEITHMRHGDMLGFRVFWNVCWGVPALMPSFFYENHIDHHKVDHYGTPRDGEYVPLATGAWPAVVCFLVQAPVMPLYIFMRFLLSPLTFLHPRLRQAALERCSSFVFNFHHRLVVPKNAPRRAWAALELACFVGCLGLLAVVIFGAHGWLRLAQAYVLAVFVLSLNYNRNLTAHHYRNRGRRMSHAEQLADSVNITGRGFWTELFFPLGLRYHALHHLFPALPYHNLGRAHRRLMAQLPADSAYRDTVYPSYWAVLRELLADVWEAQQRRRSRQSQPA